MGEHTRDEILDGVATEVFGALEQTQQIAPFSSRPRGLTVDDAWSETLQSDELVSRDRPLVVDGLSQRVHHASHQGVPYGHAHDASRALDLVTLADFRVFAQQYYADLVFFQVHGDTGNVVRELEQFPGHDFIQAMHASDAVPQS